MTNINTLKTGSKSIALLLFVLFLSTSPTQAEYFSSNNYSADCMCYANGLSEDFVAIEMTSYPDPTTTSYLFAVDDLGGDLTIDSYEIEPNHTMFWNDSWEGYSVAVEGYDPILLKYYYYDPAKIKFSFDVEKVDMSLAPQEPSDLNTGVKPGKMAHILDGQMVLPLL